MSDTTPAPMHPLDVEDDRYQRTMIYEIRCNVTGERYVGSTIRTLKDRVRCHRNDRRTSCCSHPIIDRGNYTAYEIERRPCKTRREVSTLEGKWQQKYKAKFGDLFINKKREGLFVMATPESRKAYDDECKEKRIAKASRPWACEWCGTTMQFNSRRNHKKTCKQRPVDDREADGAVDRDADGSVCAQLQPILEYIRDNVIRRDGTETDADA
jgi:hypothetical protein